MALSPSQQAAYINQGEYMAWSDPRVRAFAQFLLVDDRPKATARIGSRSYWSTFQTGLISLDGSPKPAFTAYRLPVFLPAAVAGTDQPLPPIEHGVFRHRAAISAGSGST